jgi:CBS domain-containing protein
VGIVTRGDIIRSMAAGLSGAMGSAEA